MKQTRCHRCGRLASTEVPDASGVSRPACERCARLARAPDARTASGAVRDLSPDELPLWAPGEVDERAMFELVRDNWYSVKEYAKATGRRRVGIMARTVAEPAGAWPPPVVFRHQGAEYGLGGGLGGPPPPQAQADFDADPRNVVVGVLMREGGPSGLFVLSLDRGPAGVALAGGDRPREVGPEELASTLGPRRQRLVASAWKALGRNYREALARGLSRPALLVLDLDDPGARAVASPFGGAGPEGKPVMAVATSAEEIAQALGEYGVLAARRLREALPPDGYVWLVTVSEGRTNLAGIDIASLGHGAEN